MKEIHFLFLSIFSKLLVTESLAFDINSGGQQDRSAYSVLDLSLHLQYVNNEKNDIYFCHFSQICSGYG